MLTLSTARSTLRFALLAAVVVLPACGADPAEVADLRERTAALEARVEELAKQVGANSVARTDEGLADILAVVQAVGRGQDPMTLPPDDQVGFCRGTGWTLRDLGVLGSVMRNAAQARQMAIETCKRAGQEAPTLEQLLETDPGQQWQNLVTVIRHVHEHMLEGAWAGGKEHLHKGLQLDHAPPPTAASGAADGNGGIGGNGGDGGNGGTGNGGSSGE